ncbi:MAG: type II secretion system protein [Gemmatimonadaceae bacterium]|nr:type II secretion system protein [Gemmatimonadaceae bacterium]
MRRGFTLIELVLVTVLIGILSALAVSRVSVARQRAYSSAMQSDLRNLATAQEAYFSDNEQAYARSVQNISYRFHTSPGVTIRITNVSPQGWTASAQHASSQITCSVSVDGDQRSAPTCTTSGETGK